MKLRVLEIDLHILNMRTRMPFRYGIATMTVLPHLFVRVKLDVDGRPQWGVAADHLPPKWFTKDPSTSFRDDVTDMLRVITAACKAARGLDPATTVFGLWQKLYAAQQRWAADKSFPPLLWGFGVSLVERAMIDAFCRATRTNFASAVRDNTLGIRLGEIYPELQPHQPADFLPPAPLSSILVRHTVGLADPLTDAEIASGERLDDGLPQSLESCIRHYGLTRFKIKLCGDVATDVARLKRIAGLVPRDFGFTLDGNEQYKTAEAFVAAYEALQSEPSLTGFFERLIFVEQPLHRDAAFGAEAKRTLLGWRDRPPMIIDESDGELDSFAKALECGYAGTSHKNCKGVFKGIANACLAALRRATLSGEDLANVGPVAMLQDLAVMATLGITHVERNGHHYFRGLSALPEDIQTLVLAQHGDLYQRQKRGYVTLAVRDGAVAVGSLIKAPFGVGFDFNPTRCTPVAKWRFESLDEP